MIHCEPQSFLASSTIASKQEFTLWVPLSVVTLLMLASSALTTAAICHHHSEFWPHSRRSSSAPASPAGINAKSVSISSLQWHRSLKLASLAGLLHLFSDAGVKENDEKYTQMSIWKKEILINTVHRCKDISISSFLFSALGMNQGTSIQYLTTLNIFHHYNWSWKW